MFFDMGIGELLIIGVVGLIVFGPDRLPKVAAQAAQFLRQFKEQANQAKATIIEAADIDESTLRDLRDLDPRRALRDVASPLEDIRKVATDATRLDASKIVMPTTPPAAASTTSEPDPVAPETPKSSGVDHGDIL